MKNNEGRTINTIDTAMWQADGNKQKLIAVESEPFLLTPKLTVSWSDQTSEFWD